MNRRSLLDALLIAAAVVLGIGSIALFAAGPRLRIIDLHLAPAKALAWDAALSVFFFLQHSGMVRRSFRERLGKIVAPAYHGIVYTLASGVALTLVAALWQPTAPPLLALRGAWRALVLAAAAGAVLLFFWTARAAGSFDLLGIGPLRARMRGREPRPSRFVARGPYRWVRHPLYSCVLVLLWATPAITADRLLLDVLWTAWIITGAKLEERDLTAEFGETYREYKRRVPMLLPWRGRTRLEPSNAVVS